MASIPQFLLGPDGGRAAGRRLSEALKALRRYRQLRPAEVARALDMPLRSYEHFEGGHGRLNLERIHQFAEATDTDGFAILASLALDSPEFAVRCADNKLMTILMIALQDFDAAAQDEIGRLDPRDLIAAFTQVFAELREDAGRRDAFVEAWLARSGPPPAEAPPDDESE